MTELELKANRKMPICVTGMHRSGTSLVTRMLNLCGVYIGPEEEMLAPAADNPEGFWELPEVNFINNDLLERFGGSWEHPPALIPTDLADLPDIAPLRQRATQIITNLSEHTPWGWKDPRCSLTLPFWSQLTNGMKVVICLRNPIDAAGSLTARGTPVRFGYHLWAIYYQRLVEASKDLPFIITHYDSYFFDARAELQRLVEFLELDISEEILTEAVAFVKKPLRKHSSSDSDLLKSDVSLEIVEQYLELSRQAGPVYQQEQANDQTGPFKYQIPFSYSDKAEIIAIRLARVQTEHQELTFTSQIKEQHIKNLERELAAQSEATQHFKQQCRQLEEYVHTAKDSIEQQQQQVQDLESAIQTQYQHVQELESANHSQQQQLQRLTGQEKSLVQQIRQLKQQYQNLYREQQSSLNYLNTVIHDRNQLLNYVNKLKLEGEQLTRQLDQTEHELLALQTTRSVRTSRSLGVVAHQLHESFRISANLAAGPFLRRLKGPIQGSIDSPRLDQTLTNHLEVRGWAVSDGVPVATVEIELDGKLLGNAEYGLARPDVLTDRPWQTEAYCGYKANFEITPIRFKLGRQTLVVRVIDTKGQQQEFYQTVNLIEITPVETEKEAGADNYQTWLATNEPNKAELEKQTQQALQLAYRPLISILTPVYNPPPNALRAAIQSVLDQTYDHWELCLTEGATGNSQILSILDEFAQQDKRIRVKVLDKNHGISGNSNAALLMAEGEFVALLDHDDTLSPNALYENVWLLNQHAEADMIYSDEDKLNENEQRELPFFKPDWSPELLHSMMYTCHLGVYRTDLVRQVGGFHSHFDGAQDYDLVLRLTEQTAQIYHIPKILYHWRMIAGSTALHGDAKNYTRNKRISALTEHIQRKGLKAEVEPGPYENVLHLKYKLSNHPRLSIIIPTRDQGEILRRCIDSIRQLSTYQNYEIVVVNNNSRDPETLAYFEELALKPNIQILDYPYEFNYSAINNFAVSQVTSELVLLLNNDMEVISPDWLEAMIEHASRTEVGAVGARLLYPNDTVQHGGIILGIGGVAGHSHKHLPANEPGYFCRAKIIQNLSAVTGACLMTRKEVYDAVGGLDEKNLTVAFNDVDFCLRIRQKGWRIVWTPYAELYHYESLSRGAETTPAKALRFQREVEYMLAKWPSKLLRYDPYYNPNLTLEHEDFAIAPVARYLIDKEERVTLVKQDKTTSFNDKIKNNHAETNTLP